jgi:hypothetical protein
LRITTALACFCTAICHLVQKTTFNSCTHVSLPHSKTRGTARSHSLFGQGAITSDYAIRAHLNACSGSDSYTFHGGGSWKNLFSSFGGKKCCLSISSILVMVVLCLPSLSVSASTVNPALGLVNFAALQTSAPLWLFRSLLHILSFSC